MVELKSNALGTSIKVDRLIGKYTQNNEGPALIFIGGMHGNEPSGVFALHSVLKELNHSKVNFKGEIFAFAGNLTALSMGARFIEKDLNRIWPFNRVEELIAGKFDPEKECIDEKEQRELFDVIQNSYKNKGPVCMFDLHTTSAKSRPFTTIADTLRNRQFALNFPIPIILGIEEQLEGTLLNYINELGFLAVGFEAGQHDEIVSIEIHKSVIWLTLYHTGCIEKEDLPNYEQHISNLSARSENGKKIYEVRYRHEVDEKQGFNMLPGFKNFQRIKKGELLAKNSNGNVRSKEKGMIFLPLYQEKGNDGFFLVREFMPFWLNISAYIREKRMERILPYLPGIKKHPSNGSSLIIDRKIARWFVVEILHLFGYRRKKTENGKLIVTKRKYDIHGPKVLS